MTAKGPKSERRGKIAPILMMDESEDDFERRRLEVYNQIKPKGALETMLVDDLIYLNWEISRFRRFKAAIFNATLMTHMYVAQGLNKPEEEFAEMSLEYSQSLLSSPITVSKVVKANLAEAEMIERMLRSFEYRRNELMRELAAYRGTLAQLLEGEPARGKAATADNTVPRLVSRNGKKAAA